MLIGFQIVGGEDDGLAGESVAKSVQRRAAFAGLGFGAGGLAGATGTKFEESIPFGVDGPPVWLPPDLPETGAGIITACNGLGWFDAAVALLPSIQSNSA